MSNLFTNRMGIYVPAAEITIRNDAPDSLRNDLLVIMKQFYGLKKIRNVVCVATKEAPDPNNWGENEFMNSEVSALMMDCPWYRIFYRKRYWMEII